MTEPKTRDLLRAHDGQGGIEAWIARQPWKLAPGGWRVRAEQQGWRFRLEVVADGLRVIAAGAGAPAGRLHSRTAFCGWRYRHAG